MNAKHLPEWAKTRQGLFIELYHSANVEWATTNQPVVLIGGVHGDEPEGVALAEATLHWLLSEEESISVPWIVIPCLNPEGYTAKTRTNSSGVDLNRNYPAKSWSSEAKEARYHPGPAPGSEPEIQALVKLMNLVQPRLMIHCHSWHPCIVFTGAPARRDAERLSKSSGYNLQETIGYDTPGSLSQYGWFDKKIPIICIEEQEGTALQMVWPHFSSGIREIFLDDSARGHE